MEDNTIPTITAEFEESIETLHDRLREKEHALSSTEQEFRAQQGLLNEHIASIQAESSKSQDTIEINELFSKSPETCRLKCTMLSWRPED